MNINVGKLIVLIKFIFSTDWIYNLNSFLLLKESFKGGIGWSSSARRRRHKFNHEYHSPTFSCLSIKSLDAAEGARTNFLYLDILNIFFAGYLFVS